jgi:hypothetical protein
MAGIYDRQLQMRDLQARALRGDPTAIAALQQYGQQPGGGGGIGQIFQDALNRGVGAVKQAGSTFDTLQRVEPGDTGASTPIGPSPLMAPPGIGAPPDQPGAPQPGDVQTQMRNPSQAVSGGASGTWGPPDQGMQGAMAAPPPTMPNGAPMPPNLTNLLAMRAKLNATGGLTPDSPAPQRAGFDDSLPEGMMPAPDITPSSPAPQRAGFDDALPEGMTPPAASANPQGAMADFGDYLKSDSGQGLSRMALDFFSNMAKASSKPNQTFAGSLGEGATAAAKGFDDRFVRDDARKYRDTTRKEDVAYRNTTQAQTAKYQDSTVAQGDKRLGLTQQQLDQTATDATRKAGQEDRKISISAQAQADTAKYHSQYIDAMLKQGTKTDVNSRRAMIASISNSVDKQVDDFSQNAKLSNATDSTPLPSQADLDQYRSDAEWHQYSNYGMLKPFLENQGLTKDSFRTQADSALDQLRNTDTKVVIGKDGRPQTVPYPMSERNPIIEQLLRRKREGLAAFGG